MDQFQSYTRGHHRGGVVFVARAGQFRVARFGRPAESAAGPSTGDMAMKRILAAVLLGLLVVSGAWAQGALSPKCHELPGSYPDVSGDEHAFAECWQELDEQPGCHVYREHYHTHDYIVGTANCSGELVKRGTLTVETAAGSVAEGRFINGKMNGRWVLRYPDGGFSEGSYIDGKREGRWVSKYKPHPSYGWDEDQMMVNAGFYEDGKKEGLWTHTLPDGRYWKYCARRGDVVKEGEVGEDIDC